MIAMFHGQPIFGGASDDGDIYSTEETRIGTWIDGKPVYRKTWYLPTFSFSVGDTKIADLPDDVDFVVSCDAFQCGASLNNRWTACYIDTNINAFFLNNSSSGTYQDVVIHLKYTKTTNPTPALPSVSTQSLSVNPLNSASQSSEKVLTSQVPLPSHVAYVPASASASLAHFTFALASASSTNFTFAPASASSINLTLRGD